jgi:hypothetical protein
MGLAHGDELMYTWDLPRTENYTCRPTRFVSLTTSKIKKDLSHNGKDVLYELPNELVWLYEKIKKEADKMKSLYESILDMDEKKSDLEVLRHHIENETGWTLSSDGKYILSGTKHFPGNIDTHFYGNKDKEWFEKLISCAKKYKLKIQPLGLLILDSDSIHLLEGVDIEYICKLNIPVNNPVNIDLSKIKSPIQRISFAEARNSYCDVNSITLLKTPVITASVDLYTGWDGLKNIKNMNCNNLIILDARSTFGKEIGPTSLNRLEQLVDNNPKVTNVYIKTRENGKKKYYQAKLKGREVVGIMGKSESALISKGVLEDYYQKHEDFKQWYEKHK